MPTYEYTCKSCGEHLEVVQSFKDDALTTCPNCGGDLRKVFGTIGIAFKGSGFYRTDSRPAASKSKSASPSPSTSASPSTSPSPSTSSSSPSPSSSSGESSSAAS